VIDRRAPVLVGAGEVSQRVPPEDARAPVDLLVDAALAADADAAPARSLLARVDTVAAVHVGSWRYPDPGALLARRLGITPRQTIVSTVGGNSPQLLANHLGEAIREGRVDVALLGGAECMHTRWRARREPRVHLTWESGDDPECATVIGDDRPGSSDVEIAHLALAPTNVYPLLETALRGAAGRGVEEHQRAVSELWAHFARVSADNPSAWSRVAYSPEEIRTVGNDNRMVCFPYPKRMCANIDVDQAAAVLLASYEAARDAGVPDDRMVFLHAGADAHDHWFVTQRHALAEAPAIGIAVRAALGAASLGLDDVARFDLYSCFPAAVELALESIGLPGPPDDRRPLTVTGGLGFAGGPVSNYTTHALARMAAALREDPGSAGLVTALGWYATKHSVGVWSSTPPPRGFARVDPADTQRTVDALPSRTPTGAFDGTMRVEASAVVHTRDGVPEVAIIAGLTADGRRALANTRDPDVLVALTREPWEGREVAVRSADGTNHVVAP
jgi:acetyl-CoA C-acetyltransferase